MSQLMAIICIHRGIVLVHGTNNRPIDRPNRVILFEILEIDRHSNESLCSLEYGKLMANKTKAAAAISPFLHFFLCSSFFGESMEQIAYCLTKKDMLQIDEQSQPASQLTRSPSFKSMEWILPNARAWFCFVVKWLCYSTETEKLRNFTGSVCAIVVRQAFHHFLLLWHEQSISLSLIVSSRFKCNNKRIIGHSFELNPMNKCGKSNWFDWNDSWNQSTIFHSISMWFVAKK